MVDPVRGVWDELVPIHKSHKPHPVSAKRDNPAFTTDSESRTVVVVNTLLF